MDVDVSPGAEWHPGRGLWSLCILREGVGYWQGSPGNRPIPVEYGDVLVCAPKSTGSYLSSTLGETKIAFFQLSTEGVEFVLHAGEKSALEAANTVLCKGPLHLARTSATAQKAADLVAGIQKPQRVVFRLRLLTLFFEMLDVVMQSIPTESQDSVSARCRLQELAYRMTETELLEMSPEALSAEIRCSPRHLSRVFQEVFGKSMRAKTTELRLLKARNMLLNSDAKVINIALESGYRHLGLFNTLFKKRFGVTPTKCRAEARRAQARSGMPKRAAS